MKQVSSADFRKSYASLTEVHEVTSYGHVIGTWLPTGAEIPLTNPHPEAPEFEAEAEAPEPRMTIRPVKGNPKPLVASSTKRIIDPIQRGGDERDIYSQLAAKMNQSEGSRRR